MQAANTCSGHRCQKWLNIDHIIMTSKLGFRVKLSVDFMLEMITFSCNRIKTMLLIEFVYNYNKGNRIHWITILKLHHDINLKSYLLPQYTTFCTIEFTLFLIARVQNFVLLALWGGPSVLVLVCGTSLNIWSSL